MKHDRTIKQVSVKGEVTRIIVVNHQRELLLVKSSDRPDCFELPGGKVELGETPLEGALRELGEETGQLATAATLRYVGEFTRPIPHDPAIVWKHYLYTITIPHPTIIIDRDEIIDYCWITPDMIERYTLEFTSQYFLMRIRPPRNRQ